MGDHRITIENRKKITLTDVADVDAFDEETLWANLKDGGLEITGENLNIEKLELTDGVLIVTGEIRSVSYVDKGKTMRKGLFRKKDKN